jgi:hypothetical protein
LRPRSISCPEPFSDTPPREDGMVEEDFSGRLLR